MKKKSLKPGSGVHAAGEPSVPPPDVSWLPPDSIEAEFVRLRRQVPEEEWDKLPRDGSDKLDHYLYGAPKKP